MIMVALIQHATIDVLQSFATMLTKCLLLVRAAMIVTAKTTLARGDNATTETT